MCLGFSAGAAIEKKPWRCGGFGLEHNLVSAVNHLAGIEWATSFEVDSF